jgi:hypothetical protein
MKSFSGDAECWAEIELWTVALPLSYRSGLRAGIEPATYGGMIEIKDFGIAREDGRELKRCDGVVSLAVKTQGN